MLTMGTVAVGARGSNAKREIEKRREQSSKARSKWEKKTPLMLRWSKAKGKSSATVSRADETIAAKNILH